MDKKELIERLRECEEFDIEAGHKRADDLLIEWINDPEITAAYDKVGKWYA